MLSSEICSKARLSRDPRFDGKFFTAVKTTKIYCRSICPASPPKEGNVTYYFSAVEAANAGYRPCLRCRPDSAPGSPAWKGAGATFERAMRLIGEGALAQGSLTQLAERLGISDRYLRQLFKNNLGTAPKAYALYQQCLFAKQLLYQTQMPITHIALASGFKSVRRFNDCFKTQLHLTPSSVRRKEKSQGNNITLALAYRPPYNWSIMRSFFRKRLIVNQEWCTDDSYGRTFRWGKSKGMFIARHDASKHCFHVQIELDDMTCLHGVVNNIRRVLDLDVDIQMVEAELRSVVGNQEAVQPGVRLPGTWSVFEAGIRGILGQQISVAAAIKKLGELTEALGESCEGRVYFPLPESIIDSDLRFLKMPQARKQTLKDFAQHFLTGHMPSSPEGWLAIKGIGPWTVNYGKMRGLSDPDIFLDGDLGVKKAIASLGGIHHAEQVSPWRSYLTFQLWNLLE